MSGKAIAMKSLKEKWLSIVQSAEEKGEKGIGGSSTVTISPSSEFPESYHVSVELSCLVKPLFPLPASLFLSIREDGSSHHNGKLLGDSPLQGVYQNAVIINSAVCAWASLKVVEYSSKSLLNWSMLRE